MSILGCGVVIFVIILSILQIKMNPLGVNKCLYRENPAKQSNSKSLNTKNSTPLTPSDKQPKISYRDKMTIILPVVALLVILPLFIGIFILYMLVFEKMLFGNIDFSKDMRMMMYWCVAAIIGSLFVFTVNSICIFVYKRLPRYSVKGTIVRKKIVDNNTMQRRYYATDNGYIWTGTYRLRKYCVLTISHADYYVPQNIYDEVQENESVEVVYNELAYSLVVVDLTRAPRI